MKTLTSGERAPLEALASSALRYVQIDEDGYVLIDHERITDSETGADLLNCIRMDDRHRAILAAPGEPSAIVEAFDEPYVVRSVGPPVVLSIGAPTSTSQRPDNQAFPSQTPRVWTAEMTYGFRVPFQINSLSVDEWDRFHGRAENGVPFVFSRAAQAQFFDAVDEFDDESVTVAGERMSIGPWLPDTIASDHAETWTAIYQSEEPRWELGTVSPVIASFVPRLKLPKRRVLVLGAGTGSDAAFFANMGHIVTAVDFSEEAIARAEAKHGHIDGLRFVQANAFDLPREMTGAFDLIVEHTCYCAINPSRRSELTGVWRRCLAEGGHLLGVFFTIDKRDGPPFGSSEWELRARLAKTFKPLSWVRSRHSLDRRAGQETLIYAQKIELI